MKVPLERKRGYRSQKHIIYLGNITDEQAKLLSNYKGQRRVRSTLCRAVLGHVVATSYMWLICIDFKGIVGKRNVIIINSVFY